jgi:HD-like signal output (HDOD) protein
VVKVTNKQALLTKISNIEPLPAVIQQLTALTEQKSPDINKIAKVLETEIGMTTRLLRIANSPFFGFQRQVSSINEAIVMLGLTGLKNLIMSFVIVKQLDKLGIWDILDQNRFWQHSMAVAGLGATLAAQMDDSSLKGDAFTLGIIHRLGVCALAYSFPREYKTVLNNELILEQSEFAELGLDHHEAGGLICKQWNLPVHFVSVVAGNQGKISGRVSNKARLLAGILTLSIKLVPILGYGSSRLVPLPDIETSLSRLEISMPGFLSIWEALPSKLIAMTDQHIPEEFASLENVDLIVANTISQSNLAMSFELLKASFVASDSIEPETKKCILHDGEEGSIGGDEEDLLFDVSPFITLIEGEQAVNWVALRQALLTMIQTDQLSVERGL